MSQSLPDVDSEICQSERPTELLNGMSESQQTGQLCDVILQVGSTSIPAHRAVLASSSPYFSAMFCHAMRESLSERVEIRDVDEGALVQLVKFIYTGKLIVNAETVQAVFPAANLLQLNFVRDACCRFLRSQLDAKTCLAIHGLAKWHGCSDLAQSCRQYLEVHFAEVVEQSADFLELCMEELEELLASDRLCGSEDRLFEAVIKWLGHDLHGRQQYAERLFRHVRFGLMSVDKLRWLIESKEFWDANPWGQTQLLPLLSSIVHGSLFKRRDPMVIIVAGGFHKVRSVEYFDLQTQRWNSSSQMTQWTIGAKRKIPDMPRSRGACAAVEANGLMYFLGGRLPGQPEDTYDNSVDILDLYKLRWSVGPPMQCARGRLGAGLLDGKIYAIGGDMDSPQHGSAEVLDPFNRWRYIAPLIHALTNLGVAAMRGRLYVIGHWDDEADHWVPFTQYYEPNTNSWTSFATLNTPRDTLGLCVLNDRLYAVGGDTDDESTVTVAEMYNPDTNTWQFIASMNQERRGLGLVAYDGFLYAIGGRVDLNWGSMERYDPSTNTWTLFSEEMEDARFLPGVAVVRLTQSD